MTTGIYIGRNDKARKIKKLYIGIDNVARKIKKAYIGVNGIARLFYIVSPLERGGSIEIPSGNSNGYGFIAGENSTYGIFNDGVMGSAAVHLINSSCTVTTKTNTTNAWEGQTGAGNSAFAFFMGGENSSGTNQKTGVRINTSGTFSSVTFGSGAARQWFYSMGTGCNSGRLSNTFAIFAGGRLSSGLSNTLDYVNTSGTWKYTTLSVKTLDCAVADNGTYCFIAGGCASSSTGYSGFSSTVNTLNNSGTRSTTTALSVALRSCSGARAGNLAIIGGGESSSMDPETTVNAYNTSGTRSILTNMPYGRSWTSCASAGNYALFIGCLNGEQDSVTWYADIYNASGTRETFGEEDLGYCLGDGIATNAVGNRMFWIDNYDWNSQDDYYIRNIIINR